MKILADASLPGITQAFPSPADITLYHQERDIPALLKEKNILVCRSTLRVNPSLLKNSSLAYIATASSGVDHLDEDYLNHRGIQIIDAKGSNASAVADYVVSSLAYLKKKGFKGKQAAVIGVGKVGSQVAQRLQAAEMKVVLYDPPKAYAEANFNSCSLEEVFLSDFISVHANLHNNAIHPSINLIDSAFLQQVKPGVVILNAARGGIVNEEAIIQNQDRIQYCADVFKNEPHLDPTLIKIATLCTPHIAGHSIEAKHRAVQYLSEQLHAAYGFSLPQSPLSPLPSPLSILPHDSWEEIILSLYDPSKESYELKHATDLTTSFLEIRKAHQYRHNFYLYAPLFKINKQLALLLGL